MNATSRISGWLNRRQLLRAGLLVLWLSARPCWAGAEAARSRNPKGDYVVLLHGLGRTAVSMKRLEWALEQAGYRVINVSCPSTRLSIQDAARRWLGRILKERMPDQTARIHFVTHSWGGIVLRQYLAAQKIGNLGRVVMLAPPNQGSELADKLKGNLLYQFITGPSGQQLGADASSAPRRLGRADFAWGIIAGDRTLNPVLSAWITGPDDGKVSVRSTQLPGMGDWLVVHHSHTWMAWRKDVTVAVRQFLAHGRFDPCHSPEC